MVHRPSSPTPLPIRQRLLAGASVAVIALASAAVLGPGSAVAQQGQIQGNTTFDSVAANPTEFVGDPDGTIAITNNG